MKRFARLLVGLIFSLSVTAVAQAVQLAGIAVPEQSRVDGLPDVLALNGAGIRKKFFVKVYVAALYLPKARMDAASLLAQPPANRVAMHFVHSQVDKAKMDAAWREGFAANLSKEAFGAMRPRLEKFIALFGDMREGDLVWLDHLPGAGTRVTINGQVRVMVRCVA